MIVSDDDRIPQETKRKRESVVLWFNALAAMSFAAEAKLELLQPLLPVNVYAVLSFVLIVGNAGLRVFFTKQPLQPFGRIL